MDFTMEIGSLLRRLHASHGIPGWVDLQVNGHSGVSFCDGNLSLDQVAETVRKLTEAGTYAFLPTVVTTPLPVMKHCLSVLGKACEQPGLAEHLPGIHLEGPFLSPEPGAKGAHPPECMLPPSKELFDQLEEAAGGHIRILTLAPELPGAIELIEAVSERVICSSGHSLAGYEVLREAVQAGLRMGTHIGNGMPAQVHRHDNPVIAQFAIPEMIPSFIPDGFHLPPAFIRATLAAKTVSGCVAISDQTHLAGMPPGEYVLGLVPVVLEPDGFLHMRDEPYLAGSSRTLAQCMEHLAGLGFLDDDDLVAVGYTNPIRLLRR
jgi:N-acetylglucosamine-6-phosphate deacetylase